ncbi:helix-turn-helix transcriptional regulator [Nitratireductor rhodophyticola]|uniref:helix-turn-helix domain-containing protein n=1 Tax=Nitratireductor rhodophyticola TaxID=2854036 RepID=UPI003009B9FF
MGAKLCAGKTQLEYIRHLDDPQKCGRSAHYKHGSDSRSTMRSFKEIDKARADNGLTRKSVYERAGLHKETWRRLSQGEVSPTLRTLEKLSAAVSALIEEKERAA